MNNYNMGNLENIPTVNQEVVTVDQDKPITNQEQLNQIENEVTPEQLKQAEKELIIEGDKTRELVKTEAELLDEARNLNLTEAQFKDLVKKMVEELPDGETLATLFGDEYSKEKYTHEEFIQAWEKTRWPKIEIKKFEGEKSLSEIEDIFKQAA